MNPDIGFHPPHALFLAPFILISAAVGIALAIIPYWFIFRKAGFSPWLSLLTAIPLVGIVVLYVVAFSEWRVAPAPYGYPPIPPPRPPLSSGGVATRSWGRRFFARRENGAGGPGSAPCRRSPGFPAAAERPSFR